MNEVIENSGKILTQNINIRVCSAVLECRFYCGTIWLNLTTSLESLTANNPPRQFPKSFSDGKGNVCAVFHHFMSPANRGLDQRPAVESCSLITIETWEMQKPSALCCVSVTAADMQRPGENQIYSKHRMPG